METLIVHRGEKPTVVVISIEEYNSLLGTHHELSSVSNQNRLNSDNEKSNKGKSFEKVLIEKWGWFSLMSLGKIICTGKRMIEVYWKGSMH